MNDFFMERGRLEKKSEPAGKGDVNQHNRFGKQTVCQRREGARICLHVSHGLRPKMD